MDTAKCEKIEKFRLQNPISRKALQKMKNGKKQQGWILTGAHDHIIRKERKKPNHNRLEGQGRPKPTNKMAMDKNNKFKV